MIAEPKSAFKDAAAVVVGEVLDFDGVTAHVRVVAWFKGPKEDVLELATNESSAACGYGGLTPGSRHLLYATRFEGRLHVSLCSRTRPERDAACDLRYLRSRAGWWRSPFSSLRLLSAMHRPPACG
jgi:hypothetical protein